MSKHRTIALLICAIVLSGCSQSQAPKTGAVVAKEQSAASALKAKYKDVVTGTDVQNRTLVVYIDVENMSLMDEDAEAAMKADALRRWKSIWSGAHPHAHGVLHLSMRDYYGKEIYAASARV